MAVYTKISKNQTKALLNKYDLGLLLNINGIEQGVENSNFKLKTEKGLYIFTIYEKRVNDKDLPYYINLMSHLYNNGILCPKPILDKSGKILQKVLNKSSSIVSFLPGKQLTTIELDHCFQIGEYMAKMHIASINFPQQKNNDLGKDSWEKLLNLCIKSKVSIEKNNIDMIGNTLRKIICDWPKDLPKGQIHGDLFTDNVFFQKDKLSGVIDFYFSCTEILAFDIAISINAWCFDNNKNFILERAGSIIAGYNSIRKLSSLEIENLPTLIKGAAIRFYLTRLYDWYNTSPSATVVKLDPNEYFEKLKFFNSIQNLNFD